MDVRRPSLADTSLEEALCLVTPAEIDAVGFVRAAGSWGADARPEEFQRLAVACETRLVEVEGPVFPVEGDLARKCLGIPRLASDGPAPVRWTASSGSRCCSSGTWSRLRPPRPSLRGEPVLFLALDWKLLELPEISLMLLLRVRLIGDSSAVDFRDSREGDGAEDSADVRVVAFERCESFFA